MFMGTVLILMKGYGDIIEKIMNRKERGKMKRLFFTGLVSFVFLCFGCASSQPSVYREVMKDDAQYHMRQFDAAQEPVYNAVVQAALAKKFTLDKEDKSEGMIVGSRTFTRGKRTIVLALQIKLMPQGDDQTKVFLTAVETTEKNYVTDKTRFFLLIVPLPGGGGKVGSSVKESEMVVRDRAFYNDFFKEINKALEEQGF